MPRLTLIPLSFVGLFAHLQVIPFGELDFEFSKIKGGPPETGDFCVCFVAVSIKSGRLWALGNELHVGQKTK